MIKLAVLGSTGSVGTQTLEVAERFPREVEVTALVARRSSERLLDQARRFRPRLVVSYEEPSREWVSRLPPETEYLQGEEGLLEAIRISDRVMNAISGVHGIKPTHLVLSEGKVLLASNKESVICLGELIRSNRDRIIPVDSEHNALFQLLEKIRREELRFVYITASGGPFRDWTLEEMRRATVQQALRHPRWSMGVKITVDSATLMNKGFEMLEAINLFDLDLDTVRVVVHPESVVHGAVELKDGTFLMHAGKTDMRVPIMHALFYPERKEDPFGTPPLTALSPIHFEEVDGDRFRSIEIAREAGRKGGAYLPALVGADEEAITLFLEGRVGFLDIIELVEKVLSEVSLPPPEDVDGVISAIEWARLRVREIYESEYAGAL